MKTATVLLVGLSAFGAVAEAEAQVRPYIGLGVDRARVEGPGIEGLDGSTAIHALFLVGLSHEASGVVHGLELEVGRLDEQREQADWNAEYDEAPLRLGLTAWTFGGSYKLMVPSRRWPLQPYLRLGGNVGRFTDQWSSDTPEERATSLAPGAHAGAGMDVRLGRRLWLSFSGAYSSYLDSDERRGLSLDLGGWAFGGRIGMRL